MLEYKKYAAAFSYPDAGEDKLCLEYDRLFRSQEIWLYGAEYSAENEFQKAKTLADISGFYKAFGLEADKDRPDALSCELEFMHYLLFKQDKAPDEEKAAICLDAEKKFFTGHLYPAAKKIAQRIVLVKGDTYYTQKAEELTKFLEAEKKILS